MPNLYRAILAVVPCQKRATETFATAETRGSEVNKSHARKVRGPRPSLQVHRMRPHLRKFLRELGLGEVGLSLPLID